MFKLGTRVKHAAFGEKIFIINRKSPWMVEVYEEAHPLSFHDFSPTYLQLVEEDTRPWDISDLGDNANPNIDKCYFGHSKARFPQQLAEAHFEWWYVCKDCGKAIEKFNPNKVE